MFLLALCLVGTALAAPAIREAPLLPEESHLMLSPYIAYSAPIVPLRTLEITIEPEPKEENGELPEPKEELTEPEELKEELSELEESKEEFTEPEDVKEELLELEEPKEEFKEPEEPKELLPELPLAPELPKPEAPKPVVVVKLEVPKPPSFISNWISSLPISLPNFSLPSFIGDWFRPINSVNPPKVLYPAYYPGYPGAVMVEAPKP